MTAVAPSGGTPIRVQSAASRGIRIAMVSLVMLLASMLPAAAQSQIRLAWDPSQGPVAGYFVFFGTVPGQYSGFMNVGNQTTAVFVPPVPNQIYYFVVKAYTATGIQSDASNEAAAWFGAIYRTPSLLQVADFDGDQRADPMVFRGGTGEWFTKRSSGGWSYAQFGAPALGDVPVPADYDGDGRADVAVYRVSSGQWFISHSGGGSRTLSWGSPAFGDLPVPADFDGDGRADIGVFRQATAQWFLLESTRGFRLRTWGAAGDTDMPVPGDYDGDSRADIAVYRRSTGQWFVLRDNGSNIIRSWGSPTHGDIPVPADYDGDNIMDPAVFRLTNGQWFASLSATGGVRQAPWGAPGLGDVPVPSDYDGDGRADFAVFRASTASWFVAYAAGGGTSFSWGGAGLDTPPGVREFVVVPFK
jgi:hypothetical protein